MKTEVERAVQFISRLANRHEKLQREQVARFSQSLATILCERFNDHWYPDNPLKGQAYRCIRINRKHHIDNSIQKACTACGLDYSELALPHEISIWIDPGEVCCRLGENNRYFKVKEEDHISGKSSPEPETSDYHSESPSEHSEDEGLGKSPKITTTGKTWAGKNDSKQAPNYFYVPTPLWVPCPQSVISYIPAYQPLALYYVDVPSKPPKPRKPNPDLVKRLTNRASWV